MYLKIKVGIRGTDIGKSGGGFQLTAVESQENVRDASMNRESDAKQKNDVLILLRELF